MIETISHPSNRFTWALLAFQGGYVNAGGLLCLHIFVSHVTGFSTLFSKELISQSYMKSIYFLAVPFFFLLGAFFSSIFTEVRKSRNQSPIYIQILLTISFIFFLVAGLGQGGYFGHFGEPFENLNDFFLLSLLALSCGAQNAIITHYSGTIIRTTHLTGITTDLGIGLAKYFFSKDEVEGRMNKLRIDLIVSFIIGSLMGVVFFPKLKFLGFVVPAFLSLIIGYKLYKSRLELTQKKL